MARTAVTPTTLAAALVTDPAGTTIDSTLVTAGVTVAGVQADEVILRVNNSAAGAHNLIIRAGANPPALAAGQGDRTESVAAGATVFVRPGEGARFCQADGSLSVDFETGFTGKITAFRVGSL